MSARTKFDSITLELIKNALSTISDEMMITIVKTAYSSNIRDTMDFSTTLLDHKGEMLCIGAGIHVHLGTMPDALKGILNKYKGNIYPGDVFIMNDPFEGGLHLPDLYVFKPIFFRKELAAWAGTVAHHSDIGGRMPGGNASDSTNVYAEGLRVPPLKFYERGKLNNTLVEIIRANVRLPVDVTSDLQAQLAACNIAERGYLDLVEKYGFDELKRYSEELLNYGERIMRAFIRELPDGEYTFEDYLETDGIDMAHVPMKVKVIVKGDSISVDFTGSSPQVKGALNMSLANTKSLCYFAIREMVETEVPSNGGYYRPIKVIAEPGSIANCLLPAATGARGLTWSRFAVLVSGALAKINPRRVAAAGQDSPIGVTIGGWDKSRNPFVFVEFVLIGSGARPTDDGVESHVILSAASAEMIELDQPLEILEFGYVPNTGGAGKYRGSQSVVRTYRLLADEAILQVRSDRKKVMAYGIAGGREGTPSSLTIHQADREQLELPPQISTTWKKGDVLRAITNGGGGWGDPLERDPNRVLDDVINQRFTIDYVINEYGIIIDETTMKIDITATEKFRNNLGEQRFGNN